MSPYEDEDWLPEDESDEQEHDSSDKFTTFER